MSPFAEHFPYRMWEKAAIAVLVCLFVFLGMIGHDAWWKRGEGYGFGIVHGFYTSHNWLVPTNAGEPFMEKPPLYYWTAVLFCRLLDGVMPVHEAAYLASVLYTLLTLYFSYLAALCLLGSKRRALINMLLLAGTYGFLQTMHCLITDVALTCGMAVALYGYTLWLSGPERWKAAGLWMGIGVGIAFMSKGLIVPGMLGMSAVLLLALMPALRTRRSLQAFGVGLLSAAPFVILWPTLLYHESPILFWDWLWDNNLGRFFGFSIDKLGAENDRSHLFEIFLTFAFPVLPLAAYEVYLSRKDWLRPSCVLPLILSLVVIFTLIISASCRSLYLMPLLPPLALLATQGYERLEAKYAQRMQRWLKIAFSLAMLVPWLVFWSLLHEADHRPLGWLLHQFKCWYSPGYNFNGNVWPGVITGAGVTLFWSLFAWTRRFRLLPNTAWVWLMGSMSLWVLCYSLLMPWINEHHSLRPIIERFEAYYTQSPYRDSFCIGNYLLGENIAPLLIYYTNNRVPLKSMDLGERVCPVALVFASKQWPEDLDPRWRIEWKDDGFPDIKDMELRFYARVK